MSETTTIRRHTKRFKILIVLYLITSIVEARQDYKVFVIERVAPAELNYLSPKYRPLRVLLPDLDTDFWGRRQWNVHPRVEIGPGTFKVDAVPRPPMQFSQYLKNLLRIKNKKPNKNEDLNANKDQ